MDWNNKDEVKSYNKKYYEAHKKEILDKGNIYREAHKKEYSEYQKQYKIDNKEKLKEYRESRKEETKEYNKQYYLEHRGELIEKKKAYLKEYNKTKMGRAQRLVQQYKVMDKKNGFGKVIDFDAKWIVENIFSKPCTHCGETDWHKIGCNRIDNSKPHIIENVEPCCFHCNCVLNGKECQGNIAIGKQVYQYTLDKEFVASYPSISEASRQTSFPFQNIHRCCIGKSKKCHNFIFSYEALS